jgi:formamidopyrimidine-DNA glycosylase
MPELPEIETITSGLKKHIVNKIIFSVSVYCEKLRYPVDTLFLQRVQNKKIISVLRRGKHVLIILGDNISIIIHLGMSGSLQISDTKSYCFQKHDHFILQLNSNIILCYNDPRRFGYILITTADPFKHSCFKHYGPEPLSPQFNAIYLQESLLNRKSSIKSIIMNNKIVVGIGNIYACESLFAANVHPKIGANTLTIKQYHRLVQAIKSTLKNAIARGGTTFRDYKDIEGNSGQFTQLLSVYGKNNMPCRVCHNTIISETISQRNTFYCPVCQAL